MTICDFSVSSFYFSLVFYLWKMTETKHNSIPAARPCIFWAKGKLEIETESAETNRFFSRLQTCNDPGQETG